MGSSIDWVVCSTRMAERSQSWMRFWERGMEGEVLYGVGVARSEA